MVRRDFGIGEDSAIDATGLQERKEIESVREAILEHLDDLEDLYLAERVLERVESGEERTIVLKDALKRHGVSS